MVPFVTLSKLIVGNIDIEMIKFTFDKLFCRNFI